MNYYKETINNIDPANLYKEDKTKENNAILLTQIMADFATTSVKISDAIELLEEKLKKNKIDEAN